MRPIATIILALLLLTACIDSRGTHSRLDAAQGLLAEHADSAKSVLEAMDRTAIRTRHAKARYALLYSQALDKNYIDVDKDTLIRIATNYYNRRGNAHDRSLTFFYSGRVYENAGNIDTAIMQYVKAEEFSKNSEDTYLKGLIANALAGLYASQQFCALARDKYLEAASYYRQIGHKYYEASSYVGAIWAYDAEKDLAKKKYYLDLTEKLAVELQDTTLLLYVARSKATCVIDQGGDYTTALRALHAVYQKYTMGIPPRSDFFLISNIYRNLNKPDSAYLYLKPDLDDIEFRRLRDQMEINFVAGKIMFQEGDYLAAYNFTSNALTISDSLYFLEKNIAIPELKEKYQNEQLVLRNRYLKEQNLYQFLISFFVLTGILCIFLWIMQRRRMKLRQQEVALAEYRVLTDGLQKEYHELKVAYNNTGNTSDNLKLILTKRIDFIRNMLEVTAVYAYDKHIHVSKIKELISDDKKQESNMLAIFRDMLDIQCPGIVAYLQVQHAELSEYDINLYCLSCLDLSIQAVSLTMGSAPKTVYNHRNLLRKTLEIPNDSSGFKTHFASLCAEFECQNQSK